MVLRDGNKKEGTHSLERPSYMNHNHFRIWQPLKGTIKNGKKILTFLPIKEFS